MSTWAAVSDVQARLTYQTISSSSKPTTTQVQSWLDEAEAHLRGALSAAGLPTSYTAGGDAAIMLKTWATDYAEGRCRLAWASSEGSDDNQDGVAVVEEFNRRIADIMDRPSRYGELLGAGSAPTNSRRIRAHVTNHPDGKTIAAGDFAPTFTTGEKL